MTSHISITEQGITISASLVRGWGSAYGAREIRGLGADTKAVREAVEAGTPVTVVGAPLFQGHTTRRVILVNGRLLCRMPR